MSREGLPIEALLAWSALNAVTFVDVRVGKIEGKGLGLVCERNLATQDSTFDIPSLIIVPHDLVLNADTVEEYAKEDRNFRQLLEAAGHLSTRRDILLFLLVQIFLSSERNHGAAGVSNPWTGFVKFLPRDLPLPTLWTEDERSFLQGTSLEYGVAAKLAALDAEFEVVREAASTIPSWGEKLGTTVDFRLDTWIIIDALYRSRCLELPKSGTSMVPCIDMVNHSVSPTAYYEENSNNEVVLLLRPGVHLTKGEEITINYDESKSAAELLFSYGFIDPESTRDSATFPISPLPDDPLGKAKTVAFGGSPNVVVSRTEAGIEWESQFAYLMCVNEEDGLDFRVLQDHEGTRQLRVFWQETDVTDRAKDFELLIQNHLLQAVLKLRVVTVIEELLQTQIDRMKTGPQPDTATALARPEPVQSAMLLRRLETKLLEDALEIVERQKTELFADRTVQAYLGIDDAESSPVDLDDDFS